MQYTSDQGTSVNLNHPIIEDLSKLIAEQDHNAGVHVIYIDKSGNVLVDTLLEEEGPPEWEARKADDIYMRYKSLAKGRGHVGPQAARDAEWMKKMYQDLLRLW